MLQPLGLQDDVTAWPTWSGEHFNDRIMQDIASAGPSALIPYSDPSLVVPAVYGGEGLNEEACLGPSSLCCSATTLVKFISQHGEFSLFFLILH